MFTTFDILPGAFSPQSFGLTAPKGQAASDNNFQQTLLQILGLTTSDGSQPGDAPAAGMAMPRQTGRQAAREVLLRTDGRAAARGTAALPETPEDSLPAIIGGADTAAPKEDITATNPSANSASQPESPHSDQEGGSDNPFPPGTGGDGFQSSHVLFGQPFFVHNPGEGTISSPQNDLSKGNHPLSLNIDQGEQRFNGAPGVGEKGEGSPDAGRKGFWEKVLPPVFNASDSRPAGAKFSKITSAQPVPDQHQGASPAPVWGRQLQGGTAPLSRPAVWYPLGAESSAGDMSEISPVPPSGFEGDTTPRAALSGNHAAAVTGERVVESGRGTVLTAQTPLPAAIIPRQKFSARTANPGRPAQLLSDQKPRFSPENQPLPAKSIAPDSNSPEASLPRTVAGNPGSAESGETVIQNRTSLSRPNSDLQASAPQKSPAPVPPWRIQFSSHFRQVQDAGAAISEMRLTDSIQPDRALQDSAGTQVQQPNIEASNARTMSAVPPRSAWAGQTDPATAPPQVEPHPQQVSTGGIAEPGSTEIKPDPQEAAPRQPAANSQAMPADSGQYPGPEPVNSEGKTNFRKQRQNSGKVVPAADTSSAGEHIASPAEKAGKSRETLGMPSEAAVTKTAPAESNEPVRPQATLPAANITGNDSSAFAGGGKAVLPNQAQQFTAAEQTAQLPSYLPEFLELNKAGQWPGKLASMLQRQLQDFVVTASGGSQEVYMRLWPENLGYLRMRLTMKDNRLRGKIETSQPQASQTLIQQQDQLSQRLLELNVQLEELDISFNQFLNREDQSAQGHGARFQPAVTDDEAGIESATASSAQPGSPFTREGRVDVRI